MKRTTLIATAVTLASSLMAGAAHAQQQDAGNIALPKAIADLGIPDATVDKQFETGIEGINGYVVSVETDTNVLYTTEDGRHAFIGMILGEGGMNITQQHIEEHMGGLPQAQMPGQQPQAAGNSGFSAEEEANGFELMESVPFYAEEGTGDKVLYVVYDTQCPFCTRMHDASREVLDEVTIRWVPVGYLGEQSLVEAAGIVESDEPLALMEALKRGEVSDLTTTPGAMEIVSQNSQIVRQAGITSTPTTIYQDEDGTPRIRRGALTAEQIRSL
ncbi:thioredoxin fold domain-containing protein [Halomonas faecis]|uniref:thioredoxin fold domain-containing protein n=1 Tax=Halomonas faecis TaxID=1562110 RepID=UPI0013D4BAF6|nr:thioredoxin fold domain-containing protein [Halomonas faecis]